MEEGTSLASLNLLVSFLGLSVFFSTFHLEDPVGIQKVVKKKMEVGCPLGNSENEFNRELVSLEGALRRTILCAMI